MADAEVIRMVKIKTGTVKRLQKVRKRDVEIVTREQGRPDELTTRAWNVRTVSQDLNLYKKEFEEQQNKVDRMKEEGCDEHDIKQQVQVLNETVTMIPDCRQRLEAALIDLKSYLEAEAGSEEGEEVESAKQVAADAELVFEE